MIELDPAQRRALRAAAHHLKPVVSISQKGLAPSVLTEIDRSLKAHELIKVRLYGIERDDRQTLADEICQALNCAAVQQIGNLLVLWRQNQKPGSVQTTSESIRGGAKPSNKKQAAAATEA